MNTLITPTQVLRLAFGAAEPVPADTVSEADIAAAEARYIAPAIGKSLYGALLEGGHEAFVADYLAAPAALFTRLVIQPRLAIKTAAVGAVSPRTSYGQAADKTAQRELLRSLRTEARALLQRAVGHLDSHAAEFPEYKPEESVFKRCMIHGDIVQTL